MDSGLGIGDKGSGIGSVGLGRMPVCRGILVGRMTGWTRCQVEEDLGFD